MRDGSWERDQLNREVNRPGFTGGSKEPGAVQVTGGVRSPQIVSDDLSQTKASLARTPAPRGGRPCFLAFALIGTTQASSLRRARRLAGRADPPIRASRRQ